MERYSFARKSGIVSNSTVFLVVFVPVVILALYFFPTKVSKSPHISIAVNSGSISVTQNDTVISFDADGMEMLPHDMRTAHERGTIAYSQKNSSGNVRAIVYTDGTVQFRTVLSTENDTQRADDQRTGAQFLLRESPVSALWHGQDFVVLTQNVLDEKKANINVFSHQTKSKQWTRMQRPMPPLLKEYTNSYAMGRSIFFHTGSTIYRIKRRVPSVFYKTVEHLERVAGTRKFFVMQLTSKKATADTRMIVFIPFGQKIDFFTFRVRSQMPLLRAVVRRKKKDLPRHVFSFRYGNQIYEVGMP